MKDNLMTLDEYRKSHPMDLDTVLQIGLDICRSLENGLPHGEINSSGICVTEDWEFVFDNSKPVKESDTAADIYALGMLMYRLLNKGRLPFMPPYPEKVSKEDKEQAVRRCLAGEPFPIPIEGNQRITEVLQRACHPNREMRFQSAAEMHTALTAAAVPVRRAETVPEQPFITIPEAEPVTMEIEEREPVKKQKKRKKEETVSAKKQPAWTNFQIVFALLSAILSCVYILMTKHLSLADSSRIVQIGFLAAQIVLLIFATRFRVFLKMLGVLVLVDGFCTITKDMFLVSALDKIGRELPQFYTPGYLAVILPILIAVFYLTGCLMKGRMGYLKNRFYAVITILTSLLMLFLSVTGMNRMLFQLEFYPYVTGIVILVFSILAMENKLSGIAVRVLSFLNICLAIGIMMFRGFEEMVQTLGIPVSLVEKVMIALILVFSVAILFISGKRDEDDEE